MRGARCDRYGKYCNGGDLQLRTGAPGSVAGLFFLNSTDPAEDHLRTQQQIDDEHLGGLRFTVPGTHFGPEANASTVQFGHALWWIEVELDDEYSLHTVTLLDLSGQVALGRLAATLQRQQSPPSTSCERWRIEVDPSTMIGPPLLQDSFEPMPRHGFWGEGAAGVTLYADGESRITRIDLLLDRDAARLAQIRPAGVAEI